MRNVGKSFNVKKYRVMHLGYGNPKELFTIGDDSNVHGPGQGPQDNSIQGFEGASDGPCNEDHYSELYRSLPPTFVPVIVQFQYHIFNSKEQTPPAPSLIPPPTKSQQNAAERAKHSLENNTVAASVWNKAACKLKSAFQRKHALILEVSIKSPVEPGKMKASPCLSILLLVLPTVLSLCPSECLCLGSSRNVDCSGRNLTALPYSLQDNITFLNLSHNQFVNLDNQLTRFTNLRTLDISQNLFLSLPSNLPRSLWELSAKNNNIKTLLKSDTAYQWNLKFLDVSKNKLQRAVLINNTLTSLKFLNLSTNKLWTVPTNMPYYLETADLSNNFLTQILPGTLMRLPHLKNLYLHGNGFTHIPNKSFEQLFQLQMITFYDNPWQCDAKQSIAYLLTWILKTTAHVIGYPCSNQSIFGENATLHMPPSTEKVANTLINAIPEATATLLPLLPAESVKVTKLYKQLPAEENLLMATLSNASVKSASTNDPFVTNEEGSAAENINSYLSPAADHTFIKDSLSKSSENAKETRPSNTPVNQVTGNIISTYLPEQVQQSTIILSMKDETTTSMSDHHKPSSGSMCKVFACGLILFNILALLLA
uniref:Oligodendrocyte-myelin glycoprotein n=1 Tax=Geotrypetes seraphini TaxID=260995 RepID=A0A6P8PBE4_GEOSA|nr:oligodendrocyte-myelin glycoprotein [Geotrypetes seraphini]